ncbi:hypothetical protein OIV83_004613 [Microbotryomycetes sp. JL201]|nr:hypothetical protein OIV83_004613 [Microbotryomycetes sp. JL201]
MVALVVVRTPQKLWDMLNARPLDNSKVPKLLTMVTGDAKNLESVKELLSVRPKLIVFGVGGTPAFQLSITTPVTLTDPHICASAMMTLFDALTATPELKSNPPPVAAISTTGISSTVKDVPFALRAMYKYTLHVPHVDKLEMENILTSKAYELGSQWILIKPSLLTDAPPTSVDAKCPTQRPKTIKVGWEGGPDGPAVGYTISRDDVGKWLYESVVHPIAIQNTQQGVEKVECEWFGRKVSVTY